MVQAYKKLNFFFRFLETILECIYIYIYIYILLHWTIALDMNNRIQRINLGGWHSWLGTQSQGVCTGFDWVCSLILVWLFALKKNSLG